MMVPYVRINAMSFWCVEYLEPVDVRIKNFRRIFRQCALRLAFYIIVGGFSFLEINHHGLLIVCVLNLWISIQYILYNHDRLTLRLRWSPQKYLKWIKKMFLLLRQLKLFISKKCLLFAKLKILNHTTAHVLNKYIPVFYYNDIIFDPVIFCSMLFLPRAHMKIIKKLIIAWMLPVLTILVLINTFQT